MVGGGDPGDGTIELIFTSWERGGQQGWSAMLAGGGQLRQADSQKFIASCRAEEIFLLQVGWAFEELPDSGFTLAEDEGGRQALGGEFFVANELLDCREFQAAI